MCVPRDAYRHRRAFSSRSKGRFYSASGKILITRQRDQGAKQDTGAASGKQGDILADCRS